MLDGLNKKVLRANDAWVDKLLNILWVYRTTPKTYTKESPFYLA